MRRKICCVTGSRAEYGLLRPVLAGIQDHTDLELQLVAAAMHLSPEFGLTYRLIEEDGFQIDARVEMLLSSDSAVGTAKSMGLGVIGFADAFEDLSPDILLLLGDRFEVLAAAQAALVARIPVAHMFGGDLTLGAFDDALRHAITKMSHLHFVTNRASLARVVQLGEDPERVYNVGSTGLDLLQSLPRLSRNEVEEALDFRLLERNVLVTFLPPTLDLVPAGDQFAELLAALDALGPDTGVIITGANADPEGRALNALAEDFAATRPTATFATSLGQQMFFSVCDLVDALVGNSSAGLYEAPSFGIPTVNIGDRQSGRIKAASVIDCGADAAAIGDAIRHSFELDCSDVQNPYGDGNAAPQIVEKLASLADPDALLRKRFHELAAVDS